MSPYRKADHWATTLIMQMIPKHILGSIGNTFFKNVKTVMFLPDQSHALEILTNFLFRGMVINSWLGNPLTPFFIMYLKKYSNSVFPFLIVLITEIYLAPFFTDLSDILFDYGYFLWTYPLSVKNLLWAARFFIFNLHMTKESFLCVNRKFCSWSFLLFFFYTKKVYSSPGWVCPCVPSITTPFASPAEWRQGDHPSLLQWKESLCGLRPHWPAVLR